jgi:gas vesicle protein
MSKKTSAFVVGTLIGAGLGVVGGMLLAPKKGKELRDELKVKYGPRVNSLMEDVKKETEVINKKVMEVGEEVIAKAQDAFANIMVSEQADVATEELKSVEEAETADDNTSSRPKKRYFKGV